MLCCFATICALLAWVVIGGRVKIFFGIHLRRYNVSICLRLSMLISANDNDIYNIAFIYFYKFSFDFNILRSRRIICTVR